MTSRPRREFGPNSGSECAGPMLRTEFALRSSDENPSPTFPMPVARANIPLIRRHLFDLGKFLRMCLRFFGNP